MSARQASWLATVASAVALVIVIQPGITIGGALGWVLVAAVANANAIRVALRDRNP